MIERKKEKKKMPSLQETGKIGMSMPTFINNYNNIILNIFFLTRKFNLVVSINVLDTKVSVKRSNLACE